MNIQNDTHHFENTMSSNARSLRGTINNYLLWNLSLFPIKTQKNILDLGCGLGLYFKGIMSYAPKRYCAVDNSDHFLNEIAKLFDSRQNCHSLKLDLTLPGAAEHFREQKFDYALCFDVLEHIDDESLFLNNLRSIMTTCGVEYLFLRVPAMPAIYGENDRAIGHCRRYSKKYLTEILQAHSFRIEMMRFQNILGIMPWYFIGNILKRPLAATENEGKLFDAFVPILKLFERIIPPPFGLSLACVCSLSPAPPSRPRSQHESVCNPPPQ